MVELLKLIGEIECWRCNKPIKIDLNVGFWNRKETRCPHCNAWNIITVEINKVKEKAEK